MRSNKSLPVSPDCRSTNPAGLSADHVYWRAGKYFVQGALASEIGRPADLYVWPAQLSELYNSQAPSAVGVNV